MTTYYSVSQAARVLAVSRSTVWRWIASGKLRAHRVGGRTIRIRADDLDQAVQPTSPRNDDIWKDYDPEAVTAALHAAAGVLSRADAERIKRDIKAGRAQGGWRDRR